MLGILVVDDHPLMRAGLQCLIDSTDDLRVVGAVGTAAEALEQAPALRPDVVLMDLCLPGMDGVEATRRLRGLDAPPAVIVLTSTCLPALVEDAFAAGATAYLLKDAPPQRLLAALRAVPAGQPTNDPRVTRILSRLARRAAAAVGGPARTP